jgi:hypothetical protein
VGFAVLAMGAWALLANSAHGLGQAWRPALVQGLLSGLITLVLKRALEALVRRLTGRAPDLVAAFGPPVLTATVILAALMTIHRLIGTPEIVRTIAVPWSVSTLYAFIYSAALVRGGKAAP